MGQKGNPLIFRSGISSFWKIKNYPSDLHSTLVKKFNIYNIVFSYLKKFNIEIIIYKSYIKKNYINVYLFTYMYIKKYLKNIKSLNFLSLKENLISSSKNEINKFNKVKKKKKLFKKYRFFKIKKFTKNKYSFTKNIINFQKCSLFKIKNKFLIINNHSKLDKLSLYNIMDKDIKPNLIINNNFILSINTLFYSNNIFTYLFYKNYLFIILYAIFFIKFFKNKLFRYKYALKLLNNNLLIKMCNLVSKISFFNNHYLFFKITILLKKLQLEKLLLKMTDKIVNVYLKNISKTLNIRKELKIPISCRIWWLKYLPFFKDFINILYFSMNFRISKLLALYISKNITNQKKHYNFLKKIKKIMSYFFKHDRANNFYGIYITVHGKFQGILRKRKFRIRFGRAGTQKFKVSVDYNLQNSFTRFGVFSIKVWLTYFD